jgi:hypothetical protein
VSGLQQMMHHTSQQTGFLEPITQNESTIFFPIRNFSMGLNLSQVEATQVIVAEQVDVAEKKRKRSEVAEEVDTSDEVAAAFSAIKLSHYIAELIVGENAELTDLKQHTNQVKDIMESCQELLKTKSSGKKLKNSVYDALAKKGRVDRFPVSREEFKAIDCAVLQSQSPDLLELRGEALDAGRIVIPQ